MKKSYLIPVLLTAAFPFVAWAESADLSVIGTIIPTSCSPVFAGGSTVDLRKISASSLNKTTQTILPSHDVSLNITCDAPASVEVTVRDNRAATKLPGIHDGQGRNDPALFYGIGEVQGVQIGGFGLRYGIPSADGAKQSLLTRTPLAPTWRPAISGLVGNSPDLYSWGLNAATGPTAAQNHSFPMTLLPIIGASDRLPLTNEIPLEGSVTFDMFYL